MQYHSNHNFIHIIHNNTHTNEPEQSTRVQLKYTCGHQPCQEWRPLEGQGSWTQAWPSARPWWWRWGEQRFHSHCPASERPRELRPGTLCAAWAPALAVWRAWRKKKKKKNEEKKEEKKRRKFTRKSLTLLVCQVLYSSLTSLEIHKEKLDTFSLLSSLFVSYNTWKLTRKSLTSSASQVYYASLTTRLSSWVFFSYPLPNWNTFPWNLMPSQLLRSY